MKKRSLNKYKAYWAASQLPFEKVLGDQFVGNSDVVETIAGIMATQVVRQKSGSKTNAPRVLVVGPTSSGKSYLSSLVARTMQLPNVTLNMALVTPEGYRGANLTSGLRSLIENAGGLERAEKASLITLDEICKVLRRGRADEWVQQLQYATLPLLSGDPISIETDDGRSDILRTNNSIVIAAGVFEGYAPSCWKDLDTARATLRRAGFIDEWISRFSHFLYLKPLSKKEVQVLVRREAEEIGLLYTSGKYRPTLTEREIERITMSIVKSPFGVRGGKAQIFQALSKKAQDNAIESMLL